MKTLKKFKEYAHASVDSKYTQDPTNAKSSYEKSVVKVPVNNSWDDIVNNPKQVGSIPSNYPDEFKGGNFNATV